jgi:hypothetical protein
MQALQGLRRILTSPNPFMNGHAIGLSSPRRWIRLLLAVAIVGIGVNLLFFVDSATIEKLPSQVLGTQAFHPKPYAPAPHGLESQDDANGQDYWLWETKSQFYKKENIDWNVGISDECFLFPKHLRQKVQVVLKTGVADHGARTDAMVNTIIKCIRNVLVVSDEDHKYGPFRAVDVLADLNPRTYMREEDFEAYEAQKNATRDGVQLHQGHEGWKIDKYKFLPEVERAIQHNSKAEWYIFLESAHTCSGTTSTACSTTTIPQSRTISAHRLLERSTDQTQNQKTKSRSGLPMAAAASYCPQLLPTDWSIAHVMPSASKGPGSLPSIRKPSRTIAVETPCSDGLFMTRLGSISAVCGLCSTHTGLKTCRLARTTGASLSSPCTRPVPTS